MNQQDLKQILSGTTLTISRDTLGAKFGEFLTLYYGGQPLVISQAAQTDGEDGAIVVTGKASFANVADLPLLARFTVGADGAIVAVLRYTLRGSTVSASPWKFSTSFPSLPLVYNASTKTEQVLLDTLDLYDSSFVVTTQDGKDALLGAPLSTGINFVSRLRPTGILGIFESAATNSSELVMYGSIRLPRDGELVTALDFEEHPWDRLGSTTKPAAAGIYLQAAIDLGWKVGKLTLSNAMVRIYSPISTTWMETNSSFAPVQGYTATLSIPSANIQVNLGADIRWGVAHALLYGNIEGATLGKLTNLIDITGSDKLLSNLPTALQKPVEALEKISLTRVALDLVLSGGVPTVRTAFVTVGFPNLTWKVWKDELIVSSLLCRFTIFAPFAIGTMSEVAPMFRTRVGATVMGSLEVEGVKLAVSAGSDDGFTVRTSTLAPVNLGIDKLVKSRGPGVPVPSALTINYLGLVLAPGKYYAMDALLAGSPKPWTIPVGKDSLTVSDIALHFELTASGSLSGMWSGTLVFDDDITLQASYAFPGSMLVRSRLPKVKLSQIISKLCNLPVKLPSGLDLTLASSSILIQEQNGSMLFQLLGEVEGVGVLAFEARSVSSGKWGFAYGIELTAGSPSQVGGLSALQSLEKALKLQKFMLVVSSIDQPGFQLPDSAQFNNPTLSTKKVALPGGGVVAGLNVFAEWMLDSNDKHHKMLKSLLGLEGTLQVTIQVPEQPANGTRLSIGRSGKLLGQPFKYQLGMVIDKGVPSLFLAGTLTTEIQKQKQIFDLTTVFAPSGAFMSATMIGTIDCGPFNLSNVGLEVGIDLAGLPSLGICGTIDVQSFDSSIAVFFDAGNPGQTLIAGAVSDLTLKDVMRTLVGSTAKTPIDDVLESVAIKGTHKFQLPNSLVDELNQQQVDKVASAFMNNGKVQIPSVASQVMLKVGKKGQAWHLTDLTKMRHYQIRKTATGLTASLEAQFYLAPLATQIGTISFPAGFFINGALEIFGYRAEATITMSASQGFSVDAQLEKIELGKGGLFVFSSVDGKRGPQVSISTMAQPEQENPAFRLPHFYLDGAVQLLGLKVNALASVSAKGMIFDLKGKLLPGVEFDLDVQCDSSGLQVDGDVRIGIGSIDLGALGKIKINTDVEGGLGVRISAQQVSVSAELSFEFLDEEKNLGRFDLSTNPDSLTHLVDTVTKKVESLMAAEFKDASRWANAMKNGLVDGVDDAGKVLTKVYGKSEKEAAAAAKDIASGAKTAGKAVTKTASKFGKKVKKIF